MINKQCPLWQKPLSFHIPVRSITELRGLELGKIFHSLSACGCAVIESVSPDEPREELLSLKRWFGDTVDHSLAKDGIVAITPVEGAIYDGLTTQAQSLHTDGSFDSTPPPVVALQCEVRAHEGGFSQLVQADQVYRHLAQNDIPGWLSLFDPDAIEISTTGDNRRAAHPIFRWQKQRLRMIFKSSAMRVKVTPKPEVEPAYRAIQAYISDPANQIQFQLEEGQILLMDNSRMLHARTQFSAKEGSVRRMNRVWYDGHSSFTEHLDLGFLPGSTPQIDFSPLVQIA